MVGVMAYERLGEAALDYRPVRYGASKLLFRGPKKQLEGAYAAFLGGTETYGKFIEAPFPALIEAETGLRAVNFGWPNAGVDVYLNDPVVLEATRAAAVTVLQVPGAQNMSNRFYSVHPRRNDRFLKASTLLKTVYSEVDFTEFHFTRHMLTRLKEVSESRFAMVREELREAWTHRMNLLVTRLGAPVVLVWFSGHAPGENADAPGLDTEPSFVTRAMLDSLRGGVEQIVEVVVSPAAKAAGTAGMVYSEMEEAAAQEMLGPMAHSEAEAALSPIIAHYAEG